MFARKIGTFYNVLIKVAWYNYLMLPLEFTISYEDRKLTKMWDDGHGEDGWALHLFEIDNVVIDKESYPETTREYSRRIGGPSFFISIYESQFYHFLVDGLAQFLWLKSFIPDIKIYFVNDQPGPILDYKSMDKDFVKNIVAWCQEEEGFGGEVINITTYKKIKVDKLFILANSNVTFMKKYLDIDTDIMVGDVSNSDGARRLLLPNLKEFLYSKAIKHNRLPSDFNYPSRVFLRPGLTIERMKAWQDQLEFLKENEVVLDEKYNVISDPNNAVAKLSDSVEGWSHGLAIEHLHGVRREIMQRHLTDKEVKDLDDFFTRRDYTFLDSQKMAWIDILNMVIRAEKVALLAGAAVLNAMVADEKAQIIYIESNTQYTFNHLATIEMFFKDPEPFIYMDNRIMATKKFDMGSVLKQLEKEKGHFL